MEIRYAGKAYHVESESQAGVTYLTVIGESFRGCTCPGFVKGGRICKHIRAAEELTDIEPEEVEF